MVLPQTMEGQQEFINPFLGAPAGSMLDPACKNFSTKAWLSNLVGFMAKDPSKYTFRRAGVSFRNLDVYGFGSPTDYQKTVANVWLGLSGLFRWLGGVKEQRIQILQSFDGVVESGEMLLVLGRPGSGCN